MPDLDTCPLSANSDRQSAARRNPDWMLADLGHYFGWHQRTEIINYALEQQLSHLDATAWYIERDFTIDSVPIPFTVFGPSGLFLLTGTRGHWTAEHICLMRGAADTLTAIVAGYPDCCRPAIVVLDDSREPRQEYTGRRSRPISDGAIRSCQDGCGPCWVLGAYWLIAWLDSFKDHGFSAADIARLRKYADPGRVSEPKRDFTPAGSG
jgi:hypothetical protein